MGLATQTGPSQLADEHVLLPDYFGANAGLKVTALVAGMVAEADCIDDLRLLRNGAMGKLFNGTYAPSTIGSFLRKFTFSPVRQLEAAAGRWLPALAALAAATPITSGIGEVALVDIDDTIKETYGYHKHGTGYGYSGIKGLNALIGTVSTGSAAPIIVGARLRKGSTSSARGAGKFVADTLAAMGRLRPADANGLVLLRADSAY